MKLIQAIIRPEKLDAAKDALVAQGVNGITVASVNGFGRQLGHREVYRGVQLEARLLAKVMISICVQDPAVDSTINAIRQAAQTDEIGDGKIIVTNVEQAIRIRTGEQGDASLE